MRTVTSYQPARFRKIKSLFLTALLLAMSFLAGAVAERSASFLQEAAAVLPALMEEVRDFLREQVIFKISAVSEQLKWAAVLTLLIITDSPAYLIRGP